MSCHISLLRDNHKACKRLQVCPPHGLYADQGAAHRIAGRDARSGGGDSSLLSGEGDSRNDSEGRGSGTAGGGANMGGERRAGKSESQRPPRPGRRQFWGELLPGPPFKIRPAARPRSNFRVKDPSSRAARACPSFRASRARECLREFDQSLTTV
jgi:hypothetical protein